MIMIKSEMNWTLASLSFKDFSQYRTYPLFYLLFNSQQQHIAGFLGTKLTSEEACVTMKYIHHTMTAIITPVYTAHSKFIEFLHPPSKTWSLLSLRFAQGRKDAIGNIYYFNFLKHVCAFQLLCSTQNLITYIIMFDKKKIMNTLTTNRIFENSLQFAYSFRLNSTDFKNRRAGEHLS